MVRSGLSRARLRGGWQRRSGLRDFAVSAGCRLAGLAIRPSQPDGRPMPASESPSILVIKPLALGDVLRATPFLDALRRTYPNARITFAVGDYARPALENNPHLDALMPMKELGVPPRHDLRAYFQFARELRRERFDVAFVLDRSPLMALLPFLARIPRRIGPNSGGRGFSHSTRVGARKREHEVESYLRVARAAGLATEGARCHFRPTTGDASAVRRLVQEFGIASDRPQVLIAPGGGVNPGNVDVTKRWPPERYARVAEELVGSHRAAIVVVGLPSDQSSVSAMQRAMRNDVVDLSDLSGQISFGQLGALIEQSALCIANDSAAAQLAACVGTPSVTVFTTTDPQLYGPYAPNASWVDARREDRARNSDEHVEPVVQQARAALAGRTAAHPLTRPGQSERLI